MRCAASLALLAVAHATLSPPRRERQGLSDGDQSPRTPTPRNPLEGAYQDYHGARQTPRSGPRGDEVGAGGEWRIIMGANDFNNLCAALDNTHFTDDQKPRLYRSFCRLFGNEDGAGSRFGDGDDDADGEEEQNEVEDGMSQNAPEWDPSLAPQLLDEEQMILEISEQESEINLDIWRRAYEMDYELREEEESTSWFGLADWYYWVYSGQPSRMERGAYLLKNTAPVDGSYHLIKCYKLPSAWTVSLAAYKNQNTPRPHAVHERREHHVVRDTRDAAFARRRVRETPRSRDAAFAASGLLLYKLVDFNAGRLGRSRASRLSRPLSPGRTAHGEAPSPRAYRRS